MCDSFWRERERERSQQDGPLVEKGLERKSKRTRQKNKRGDRRGDSNDSPGIPDKGQTSDISGHVYGGQIHVEMHDTNL